MAPEVSVIVPLWNERENVAPLVRRIFEAFRSYPRPIELLLVDDRSSDDTWQEMLAARLADPRVRPLQLARHSGQSAALWQGIQASRGTLLATLDGDLQNDPADLPSMLAALSDFDLVCGVRTKRQDNWLRRVSTVVARRARKAALGVDFRDTGCNLRAFKRSVVPWLFPFDGLHRFMPILVHYAGGKVKEVPALHHPRTAGQSKYGVWNRLGRGVCDLAAIAWYRKRQLHKVSATEFTEPAASD